MLNSRMYASAHITPVVISVSTTETPIQNKLLQSYSEVLNYLLYQFANDQASCEMNSRILRHTQRANMTPMQFASDLHAKSCKVADIYAESSLKDIFIEGVDPSICHSTWKYGATDPQIDLTDILYKEQSLLLMHNGATKSANTGNSSAYSKQYGKRSWMMLAAHTIEIESSTSPTR